MAIEHIFKEKKYPFVLALSVLLITVTVFVLTTTTNPISSVFFFQQQSSRNATVSHTTNDTVATPLPSQDNNANSDDSNNNNNKNTPSPTQDYNTTGDTNSDNNGNPNGDNNGNTNGDTSGDNNGDTSSDNNGNPNGDNNGDTNGENNGDTSGDNIGDPNGDNNGDSNSDNNGNTNSDNNGNPNVDNNGNTNSDNNGNPNSDNNGNPNGDDNSNTNSDNNNGDDNGNTNGDINNGDNNGNTNGDNNGNTNGDNNGDDSSNDDNGDNSNGDNNGDDSSSSDNNGDDSSSSDNNGENGDNNNTTVVGSDSNNNNASVDGSDSNKTNDEDANKNNTGDDGTDSNNDTSVAWSDSDTDPTKWTLCKRPMAADYIPCLDNNNAIKKLKSRKHMEHRERHCPNPPPRCLVPLPDGYKQPIPWPKSRDMIRFDNVPHPKLVEYKKGQNWVVKSGEYFEFPGGGTQFKQGVTSYLDFIQRTFPPIIWGKDIRVVLDVGCGVASFGGYLLDKNVLTMSLAPKDEHEAQIQFALERGIPAVLSVIGTQKLPFPDDTYDLIHCARCRVHWDADGGKPLLELNRLLRPGGFFVWSATPVYKEDDRHRSIWQSMKNLTASICWKVVAKAVDSSQIGLVIFQKPISYNCYKIRVANDPPLCDFKSTLNSSWYQPLERCVSELPLDRQDNVQRWPNSWPKRLKLPSVTNERREKVALEDNNIYWSKIVSSLYLEGLSIDWSRVRNVMDMNATYGGFAAALIDKPLWVMNVIPIDGKDTLPTIFDRGLFGIYHDWCESFSTYPRTYDLLHSSYLLTAVSQRCDVKDVLVEIDRILRPDGYFIIQDSMETINKVSPILRSLHWSLKLYQNQFLLGVKGFWRP